MKQRILTLFIGMYFGIVLTKSQVVSWFQIQDMFLFRSAYMYLVIASAVAVGALSLFIIRRLESATITGEAIVVQKKPFHKGVVYGGTLFGMGWAITGACPGPIYSQIGAGAPLAIITFLGGITGLYLYALVRHRLPHNSWHGLRVSPNSSGTD